MKKRVDAFAEKLIQRPEIALRAAKTAVHKGMNLSLKDGLYLEKYLWNAVWHPEIRKRGCVRLWIKELPEFLGR